MPSAFCSSAEAKVLLENRRLDVSLGPFDGRVTALHPQHRDFYIATPNQDDVFAPPGPCNVYARFWTAYFKTHGRNLTLVALSQCIRLVQVEFPNRLRGEVWETLSGSIFFRFTNPRYYDRVLEEHKGRTSTSTEDIEKDSHRSLAEYAGYQSEDGIVHTTGCCKRDEHICSGDFNASWLLEVLCDRSLPRYYAPLMHGTLLDQRIFEALVARCPPMIHNHFEMVDVQLPVASLPWFLSLYINSMPMVFDDPTSVNRTPRGLVTRQQSRH
ncbi:hypothetical protein F5887DRAFT_1081933 [Amanita rubescens]|nr:hypothetical protein F5887DRAFT_1081933 [Amanita rubescens]